MPDLQEVFGGQEEARAVGKVIFDGEVVFLVPVAGILHVELLLEVGGGEDVVGAAERGARHGTGCLQRAALCALVAVVDRKPLTLFCPGLLGDHVHHAAGRGAAIDGGVVSFDDFDAVNVAGTIAAEAEEAVAELGGGTEAAQVEASADVETGEAADLDQVVGELKNAEVLEELAGDDVDGVGQLGDLRAHAAAG